MKHTVTEHKLDSGAEGLFIDIPGADVVCIEIRFNSGFQFAGKHSYELPHVVEHLISCGSKLYPLPNQFKTEVQKNGAFRNAFTSSEMNAYVLEFASFETERMMGILNEYLTKPLFPEQALPTELSNVREELTQYSANYGRVASINFQAEAYPGRGERLATRLGGLDSITLDDVRGHYEKTHTAGNMRFFVAGGLAETGKMILEGLASTISQLPKGERLMPNRTPGRFVAKPIIEHEPIPPIYYRLGIFEDELTPSDRRALVVLRAVLFAGYRSRIYGEARRLGLAYHIEGVGQAVHGNSTFGVGGFVTPDNATALFELVSKEIRRTQTELVSTEELDSVKQLIIGSSLRGHQTVGDMLSWYADPYDDEGTITSYEEYLELLRQVTPKQVRDISAMFQASSKHAISFVGDISEDRATELTKIFDPIWK